MTSLNQVTYAIEELGRTYQYGAKLSSLYQKICSESPSASENKDLRDLDKNALKQVLASGTLFETVRNYFEHDHDLDAVIRSTNDIENQVFETKKSLMLFMDKLAKAIPPESNVLFDELVDISNQLSLPIRRRTEVSKPEVNAKNFG